VATLHDDLVLDDFGVLRDEGRWIALSPVQEALMGGLLGSLGEPVSRADLVARAWPEGEPFRGLDAHVARLRRKVRPLGLVIHTIRARGFVLERSPAS
jgi:DNA-binding response OmpR family regulator